MWIGHLFSIIYVHIHFYIFYQTILIFYLDEGKTLPKVPKREGYDGGIFIVLGFGLHISYMNGFSCPQVTCENNVQDAFIPIFPMSPQSELDNMKNSNNNHK
ncbi:hypothetical protein ACJX0J_036027, partial [Zea mays]